MLRHVRRVTWPSDVMCVLHPSFHECCNSYPKRLKMKALVTSRRLYTLACGTSRQQGSCKALFSSTSLSQSRSQRIEESEVEAADPFLSKLQQQTEASYLELLSRREEVPQTEDDQAAEEQEEVELRLDILSFCVALMQEAAYNVIHRSSVPSSGTHL